MPHFLRAFGVLAFVFSVFRCVATAAGPAASAATAYTLTVASDRAEAIYAQGEKVTFEIALSRQGRPVEAGEVAWLLSKDGVPPIREGSVALKNGRATVTGSLDEPGFLQCKVVFKDGAETVTALAGAGVDPTKIQPSMPRPADFDAFWDGQLARLATVPINARLTPVPAPADRPGIELFDLQADSIGAPVSGYYARPIGAKRGGLPARLCVDGAGVRSTDPLSAARWAQRGVISLAINAHGIANGQPGEFYAELDRGVLKTYRVEGRESRDTYYFLGMFLRVKRALDFLAAQPEWDGRTLMIEGGSQGGAQAMAGAALDPRVTFYTAMVTAMCDHTGMVAGRVAGWPKVVPVKDGRPDPAALETSRYFDMVNFAPRIKARGYFWVGFLDPLCPPTTVYAAYNQLRAPKEMVHAITSTHSLDGAKLWPAVAAVQQKHVDEQAGAVSAQPAKTTTTTTTTTPPAATRPTAAIAKPVPNVLVPDPARVKEIAGYLPARPKGIGPSIDDRGAWDVLKTDANLRETTLARATRFLGEPIPVITQEAYDASAQSGDRKIDASVERRRFRLVTLVLAEGMENQGGFVPAIEKEVVAICEEPSWISSSHVKFSFGRNDLGTAMTAWNLATTDTFLGDRLSAPTRRLLREKVKERVLVHYLATIRGQTKPEWWSIDPNNWNAVVHGGIVGSALALLESVEERAEIVAAAEIGTQFYIRGFPADGYSPEGMGYWKYGFGHYVLLAETVAAATGGKVGFYDRDNIRLVAQFPRRFEIGANVYPAYGDALFLEAQSDWLFHLIDRRYALGDGTRQAWTPDPMYSAFLYAYGANLASGGTVAPVKTGGAAALRGYRLRDWFEQSQVYVGRPREKTDGIAVSFKAGNNGVSHGHNDLGTFVVVHGGQPILVDPGVTVYNASTMGPDAYAHQVKASYGHSVPLVAGQWQKRGAQHAAVVKEQTFSDARDTVTFDLARAYDVAAVRELTRRFDYVRAGSGGLTVTDAVSFSSPQTFGTALVTYGDAREQRPGIWLISYKGKSLRAEITASGGGNPRFTVTDELLKDESRFGKVRRLGVNLDGPVTKAVITIKITPADAG